MESSCDGCTLSKEILHLEQSGRFQCTKRIANHRVFLPTMMCVGCNDDNCSNCDLCPGNPIETWAAEPAYASTCAAPSESLCEEQWMDYAKLTTPARTDLQTLTCRSCQGDANWSPPSQEVQD